MNPRASHQSIAVHGERRLFILGIGALACSARGAHMPESLHLESLAGSRRLQYRVVSNQFPFWLNGELQWQREGARYTARLSYSLLGQSRYQISRGVVGPQGLQPEQFTDHVQRDLVVRFDQQARRANFEGRIAPVVLSSGAQDRLSALLQLGLLAASLPASTQTGASFTMQTLGHASADLWTWRFERVETLSLPQGKVEAQKWLRQPLQSPGQQLEVWLAPSLSFWPARIRITEPDGDYVDQQWLAPSTEPRA